MGKEYREFQFFSSGGSLVDTKWKWVYPDDFVKGERFPTQEFDRMNGEIGRITTVGILEQVKVQGIGLVIIMEDLQ